MAAVCDALVISIPSPFRQIFSDFSYTHVYCPKYRPEEYKTHYGVLYNQVISSFLIVHELLLNFSPFRMSVFGPDMKKTIRKRNIRF
jgi:hypothetical protein